MRICRYDFISLFIGRRSVATSEIATAAVRYGACLITHLFNAMPQLHHRDPSIIGLLGASPHLSAPLSPLPPYPSRTGISLPSTPESVKDVPLVSHSEALDDTETPPQTPAYFAGNRSTASSDGVTPPPIPMRKGSRSELHLEKGQVADMAFERPFYGLIVDGIHSHPNSIRVRFVKIFLHPRLMFSGVKLAYTAHPEGCILITDGK